LEKTHKFAGAAWLSNTLYDDNLNGVGIHHLSMILKG